MTQNTDKKSKSKNSSELKTMLNFINCLSLEQRITFFEKIGEINPFENQNIFSHFTTKNFNKMEKRKLRREKKEQEKTNENLEDSLLITSDSKENKSKNDPLEIEREFVEISEFIISQIEKHGDKDIDGINERSKRIQEIINNRYTQEVSLMNEQEVSLMDEQEIVKIDGCTIEVINDDLIQEVIQQEPELESCTLLDDYIFTFLKHLEKPKVNKSLKKSKSSNELVLNEQKTFSRELLDDHICTLLKETTPVIDSTKEILKSDTMVPILEQNGKTVKNKLSPNKHVSKNKQSTSKPIVTEPFAIDNQLCSEQIINNIFAHNLENELKSARLNNEMFIAKVESNKSVPLKNQLLSKKSNNNITLSKLLKNPLNNVPQKKVSNENK